MAARAESSRMAQARLGLQGMRLHDDFDRAAADMRVGAVPRSIAEEATKGTEYPGKLKFKERARDSYHVDEPLLLGESGPRHREISPGISMHCTATQKSPFDVRGKFFYAVDFDDSTFVNHVVFDNCVFIYVSFKGCILSDVRFINVSLQDMEFVGCDFNDTTWLSRGEFNQTWAGRIFKQATFTGNKIPEEVGNPEWLVRMMGTQIVPERVETEPGPEEEILIHQSAGRPSNFTVHGGDTIDTQDGEPGIYDFSRLGNLVHHSYNGALDEETRVRRLSEWEMFAQQQENEREQEREEEDFRQAVALSSEEAAARHKMQSEGEAAPPAAAPDTTTDPTEPAPQKNQVDPFASLWNSVKTSRQPLRATSGNVPQGSLPPHLRGKAQAATPPIAPLRYCEEDDDLDEPVYRPVSRFGR